MNDTSTGRLPSKLAKFVAVPLLVAVVSAFVLAAGVSAVEPAAHDATAKRPQALLQADAVPVHGVAENGAELVGTFQLKRFEARDGVLYAVGQLQGQLGERNVHKNVRLPVMGAVSVPNPPSGIVGVKQQPIPTPGACDILTLALGPLDLDLLGLRVALDEVNLLIEAIPGAGNLLGNLLCAVAGLLDPGPVGGLPGLIQGLLDAIANLLNGLLGGL